MADEQRGPYILDQFQTITAIHFPSDRYIAFAFSWSGFIERGPEAQVCDPETSGQMNAGSPPFYEAPGIQNRYAASVEFHHANHETPTFVGGFRYKKGDWQEITTGGPVAVSGLPSGSSSGIPPWTIMDHTITNFSLHGMTVWTPQFGGTDIAAPTGAPKTFSNATSGAYAGRANSFISGPNCGFSPEFTFTTTYWGQVTTFSSAEIADGAGQTFGGGVADFGAVTLTYRERTYACIGTYVDPDEDTVIWVVCEKQSI